MISSITLRNIVAVTVLAAVGTAAPAAVIVSTDFVTTGSNQPLNGTTAGLTTNLPGGNWVWGAGWNWSQPLVQASWLSPVITNTAALGEEKTAIALSVASTGGYTKPQQLRISSDLIMQGGMSNNMVGLGFWGTVPARLDAANAFTGFTGLVLEETTGELQVYTGGAFAGSPVVVGSLSEGVAYNVSYEIDTTTGVLSNVKFNNASVTGLSSSAFTDANTGFAGAMSGNASRSSFDTFTIESVTVPEPTAIAALATAGLVLVRRRRA